MEWETSQVILGDEIEYGEIGGTCSTYERDDYCK
jgi:hypothetical protein